MNIYGDYVDERPNCDDCRYDNRADYYVTLKGFEIPMCHRCVDKMMKRTLDATVQENLQFFIVEEL